MGITNLGPVSMSAGGVYNPETEYKKYKVVSANGGSYMYINPTPAAGVPLTDTSHWQQLVKKGETGERGAKGDKGETGEQGIQGAKGDKGVPGVSVTVGTTTTGAAGTNANVTNSGTESDPVLNFTIPQGATSAGVPDGGTDGQIIVKSGVSAVWQDQNTVDGIAAIDGNIPLSAARQYSTMPTVTTADNGTIAQYIGTDETTYKTGHWYEVVNGAWEEIVYGDPNSVSYDTQTGKTDAQKTQARTNIDAAESELFSRNGTVALPSGYKGIDVRPFSNGISLGVGVSAPNAVNNVDVAAALVAPLRNAIGAQAALSIQNTLVPYNADYFDTTKQSSVVAFKYGKVCVVAMDGTNIINAIPATSTNNGFVTIYTLPNGYKPNATIYPILFTTSGVLTQVQLNSSGEIQVRALAEIPANTAWLGQITYFTA